MLWRQAARVFLWLSLTILGSLPVSAWAADTFATIADPDGLGFSAPRLARIDAWYRGRAAAGDVPGAVIAIAKDGKLAHLEAIGFQDWARTVPIKRDSIF